MEATGQNDVKITEDQQPASNGPIVEVDGLLSECELRYNGKQLVCPYCASKVLPPKMGFYEDSNEYKLQVVKKNAEGVVHITKEKLSQFYRVEDMFDFDNVGFSKNVDEVKYLICADCEAGPIGYHDLKTQKSYVALSRITHQ